MQNMQTVIKKPVSINKSVEQFFQNEIRDHADKLLDLAQAEQPDLDLAEYHHSKINVLLDMLLNSREGA